MTRPGNGERTRNTVDGARVHGSVTQARNVTTINANTIGSSTVFNGPVNVGGDLSLGALSTNVRCDLCDTYNEPSNQTCIGCFTPLPSRRG